MLRGTETLVLLTKLWHSKPRSEYQSVPQWVDSLDEPRSWWVACRGIDLCRYPQPTRNTRENIDWAGYHNAAAAEAAEAAAAITLQCTRHQASRMPCTRWRSKQAKQAPVIKSRYTPTCVRSSDVSDSALHGFTTWRKRGEQYWLYWTSQVRARLCVH